ncbi:Vacuolar protein sorting-associated protein 13B [Symbiodinium microadriaticum]|uniref:Vacuolar protein sorting-associated protein 13B n=1 Tax=Symbiodinium microadriaticum TaxID=2951 RepID=A0A1Q9EG35_SYMMI|nr:Vacuolar protein sorting-associated protein 13B [Symbiodinium microadriaticum]
MLEAVLTRIILRYAQRYICDTLRTDSLSLWGGDLRVANFELRTEELARVLGTEESSIQLTRGFVRELRVVVPWNAIRSQSLRVEVDAVEIIFGSGSGGHLSYTVSTIEKRATSREDKESSQDALDESQETWLQPLLRNIFGNVTVSIDNLVAKLERNGAVACVTVERLDSRPHSATWEAGFTPLPSLQPTLFRVVSVRDVTVTLDHLQQAPSDRKGRRAKHHKALGRALRQVALPILHRVSAEVLLEWPWLPWSQPAPSPPTGRVGFYLSPFLGPVRARLAGDQAQGVLVLFVPAAAAITAIVAATVTVATS